MKKVFLLLLLICTLTTQAQTYWDGTADKNLPGEGTEASPYLISTPEQLAGLAERTNVDKEDFSGKYIKLTADIYLTDYTDPNQENWKEWHPIAHEWWKNESQGGGIDHSDFRGHFDGCGHTVYNLYYNGGAGWGSDWDPEDPFFDPGAYLGGLDVTAFNRGLFANVDGGTIENLNIGDARMNGVGSIAMLAVKTTNGAIIRNCHVQGEFRGFASGKGGVVSENGGLIENCSANISISPSGGGIIAHTNKPEGIIRNCTASGSIYATATSTGCFLDTNEGLIEQCSSSADVTALYGMQDNGKYWGHNAAGFLATNLGIVRECSATGKITVNSNSGEDGGSGGFCQMNLGLIESCYSTGDIICTGDGGEGAAQFVANNGRAQSVQEGFPVIRNCFSTGRIIYTNAERTSGYTGAFLLNYNGKTNHDFARHPFCWFNADGVPLPPNGGVSNAGFACWGQEEAVLKTQAFVDTLNLCASFLGTSQWELKDGIPQPTGVYIKDTKAFFDGGEGTKESPYLINSKKQLENFRWMVNHGYDFMNEYVLQTADIELNVPEEEWEYVEPEEWVPIGIQHSFPGFYNDNFYIAATENFMGNYDGGFHEIKNLYIENNKGTQGFFGNVGADWVFDGQKPVVIQNLGVTDAFMVVTGGSGILAASVGKGCIIKQCWTSGYLETPNNWGNLGALFGNGGDNGHILNCSSSARIKGTSNSYYGAKGFVSGNEFSGGWIAADTLVNYLFIGNINNGENGFYGGGYYSENVYEDGEVANITHDGRGQNGVRSTVWLQSKEYVNQLNATVQRWNSENDELKQLNYWQWREGAYPVVSPTADYDPGYAVTFNSNGGSEVAGMMVVAGSTIQPPVRPKKENYLFGGWYKDEELTQLFKFGSEPVEEDLTLYARWLEDKRFDYDITPFSNKRAKTYHIQTAAQLRGFAYLQNGVWQDASATELPRDFSEKTIVLDNDIFLNDTTDWQQWGKGAYAVPWRSIGTVANSYQSSSNLWFNGTFDGQGHVIYGMYVERGGLPSLELGGLFYRVGDGATIQNLGIEASVLNLDMQNPEGQTNGERWYYWGDGTYWMEHPGMLANLFGNETTVSQCYTQGTIYMPTDNGCAGALTGNSATNSTTNCYSRVDIYQKDQPAYESGFIAVPTGGLTNCYNAGKVHDGMGRAGYDLRGDYLDNFYFDKELISNKGYSYDILKVRGRSTEEMKMKGTYKDWDFETTWGRNDSINDGYPYLRIFHPNAPADSEDPIMVTGITFEENMTSTTLVVGETKQLHAAVVPENAGNKNLIWTVTPAAFSDASALTIDENGLLTAHKSTNGHAATVTVTSEWGHYSGNCYVSVRDTIHPTSIHVHDISRSMNLGDTQQLSVTFYPDNSDNKNVVWTSSDETILTVSETGLVTAVGFGTANITATAEDQTNAYEGHAISYTTLNITIAPILVNRIEWQTEPKLEMAVGDTQQLAVILYPDNATDKTVSWTSSDTNVLTVSQDGLVTAVGEGRASITATAEGSDPNWKESVSTWWIEVKKLYIPVESIVINEGDQKLGVGESKQLTVTILPKNATDQNVYWESSSRSGYVTVEDGLVTVSRAFLEPVLIRATASNGVSTTITVTYDPKIDVVAEGYTGIYDGQPHGINVTATEGGIVMYGTTKETYDRDESPAYTNAGEYTVYYRVDYQVSKNRYEILESGSEIVTITKAPLTVTADDSSMEEGSKLPPLTVSYDGWKNGEDDSVLTEKPVATTTATPQSPMGEYPITVSGGKALNYSFIYVDGTFTITMSDGIDGTSISDDVTGIARYDIHGRKIAKPQKGINIIRYPDGTIRKMMIK